MRITNKIFNGFFLGFGLLALIIAVGVFYFLWVNTTWHPYIVWLIALSAATFGVYGLDKGMAVQQSDLRSPEILLHLLAILGGFFGGWFGMLLFRHKTKHYLFSFILLFSTLLHAGLVYLGSILL